MRKISIIISFFCLLSPFSLLIAQYQPNWQSLDQREIPSWWGDAKFGIFIHWGLYSVPAYAPVNEVKGIYEKYAEHYYNRLLTGNKLFQNFHNKQFGEDFMYTDFAPIFKAEYFDPVAWANLFKEAGAKYVVLTSKHHDGFCLWPSAYSPNWNSMVTGPKMDIIDTLSKATRNADLHFGLYYSLLEWANPLYSQSTIETWVDTFMIPQMKELINAYQPEIIFSDGEWDYDSKTFKSEEFLAWLYNSSPVKNNVVVNDRWGKETRSKHGDYFTTEYDFVHNKMGIGDNANHPWEESRGIGTSYGYNRFETSEHYLTSQQLVHTLIDKVSNGGNFLLNVGPDANGLIPVVMQERLLDIGHWLKVNGDAIYATKPWQSVNKPKDENIAFTQKDDNLFVIIKKWQNEPVVLLNIKSTGRIELLGYNGVINTSIENDTLNISLPLVSFNKLPCEYAWVFKIENFEEK